MKNVLPRFLILLVFVASGSGQMVSAENEFCHADYAKFLVSQQVTESGSVSDSSKRIKILIRSADFIWPYDEPAARSYFTDAFAAAKSQFREKGYETRRIGEDARSLTTQLPDQRFEVLRAIAKHDAAWARKLTDEILNAADSEAKDKKDVDRSRELSALLQLAQTALETDPNLSLYLFRRAMRYPLGHEWYFTLYSVSMKNREFSDALYPELVRNYRNSNLRALLFLSAYPFARPRIFGAESMSFGVSMPDLLEPNRELQRLFLDVYFARIAAVAADPGRTTAQIARHLVAEPVNTFIALRQLEPIITADHPDMIQRLALARAQVNSLLTEEMRRDIGLRDERAERTASRTFEDRIKELEEAFEKGTLTDSMIVSLITMLTHTEEQFAALEPWIDKIKDEKLRYEAANYYWYNRSYLSVKEARLRDAEKYSEKVAEADHRAMLAFAIAEKQLEDINDAVNATQTLSSVSKVASTLGNTLIRARVRLGLANMYAKVNPSFSISELSDAVAVMNQLKEPDLTTGTIYRQIIGKDFAHYAAYSVPSFDLETTFRELSKIDISLPLSNARAIDDRYLRAIAVLAVASNCIEKKKPAEAKTDGH